MISPCDGDESPESIGVKSDEKADREDGGRRSRVPAIMPHVSSSGGGDDLGSEDEVKVFKDEGEEEKRSSENLTEDKSDLIDLTESEVRIISSSPTDSAFPFFSIVFRVFPRYIFVYPPKYHI